MENGEEYPLIWRQWAALQAQGGGTFDPLADLAPVLFLDFVSGGFTLENTDRITQWDDLSGNGKHATAPGGSAARPTLGSEGVEFDGIGNKLNILSTVATQTIFAVADYNGTTFLDYDGLVTGPLNENEYIYAVGSEGTTYFYDNLLINVFVNGIETFDFAPLSTKKIVCVITDAQRLAAVVVGRDRDRDFSERLWNGTIYHVAIFPYALTDAQRRKYERYLASRYGVSL
jgi:hypothetical protein